MQNGNYAVTNHGDGAHTGNLWYGGNKYVGETIGVAAPRVTPIVTATFDGKLTTHP